MGTGSHELVILSYATACLHPSVTLNNEKNCREISKDKIAVSDKTAGLRSENSSDLHSACLKALVSVEIFQFSDMHYESRFLDTFRGHNIRPTSEGPVTRYNARNERATRYGARIRSYNS